MARRIFWLLASLCVMQMRSICAMCLALMLGSKLYNSGFTCGYHVLINYNLFVYTGFFVDTYHDYFWSLRIYFFIRKFIYFLDIIYSLLTTLCVPFISIVASVRGCVMSACMFCIQSCILMCFECILDPCLTWWSHWIFLFYLVQNMFFGSFECFPPMSNLIFIS